ncbi:MAG: PTS sugar transporter subunit IIA [Gemmatimonadota bacterium]|jgi:PTS system nitrogen regulatory IIA component
MRLKDFFHDDLVLLRLQARDVEGVVAELAKRAGEVGVGPEALIREKLMARERKHPTVMGSGLAIPHATVPGLDGPAIGVALAGDEAIPFGGTDQDPVRIFFVLLSPPGFERGHVKLLARICRLVRHEGFIDSLEAAEDSSAVVNIIQSVDAQHV